MNDEITIDEKEGTSEEFLRRMCPKTEFVGKMGERDAPVSNAKLKAMVGFREEFPWRKVLGRE